MSIVGEMPLVGEVPADNYFKLRATTKLFDHQKSTIAWASGKSGAILALSMGLGKTIASLALVSQENLGKVLIVGPKSLLSQWQREIVQHFTVSNSDIFLYHGAFRNTPVGRATFLKAKFVLTTYQTARSDFSTIEYWLNEIAKIASQRKLLAYQKELALAKIEANSIAGDKPVDTEIKSVVDAHVKADALLVEKEARLSADLTLVSNSISILSTKFGHIILDEAHNIRNPKTLMFRAMKYLKAHKRWALTGTPGINNRHDIIVLADFLGISPYNDAMWWINATQAEVDIWRETYLYQVNKDDVLKLPPKTETTINVTFGPIQQEAYNKINNTKFPFILTKILRLRQATVHNVLGPDGEPENIKFETIWNLISDDFKSDTASGTGTGTGPLSTSSARSELGVGTLIFSSFITALTELSTFLTKKNVKNYLFHGGMSQEARDNVVSLFISSNEPSVMLISIRAGAVGLNLTRASRVIIMDPYWNRAIENQAIDRAHRIGQTKPVSVHRLSVVNSIDEWVSDRQITKTTDVENFIAGKATETPAPTASTADKITNNPTALGDDNRQLGTKYF